MNLLSLCLTCAVHEGSFLENVYIIIIILFIYYYYYMYEDVDRLFDGCMHGSCQS